MKTVLTALAVTVFAQAALAVQVHPKWNRPEGAKGHEFFYVNGNDDVPVFMRQLVWIQTDRVRELETKTLPADHVHIFSGDDYLTGKWDAALQSAAHDGTNDPIDLFTLSHSGGTDVNMPDGFHEIKDTLLKDFPPALVPRLRLFMNAGCEGAYVYQIALPAGFPVTTGARGISIGNLVLDDFLTQWLQGATVIEASARVNYSCRHSALWWPIIESLGESPADYCPSADQTVVEGLKGAGDLTITSDAP